MVAQWCIRYEYYHNERQADTGMLSLPQGGGNISGSHGNVLLCKLKNQYEDCLDWLKRSSAMGL